MDLADILQILKEQLITFLQRWGVRRQIVLVHLQEFRSLPRGGDSGKENNVAGDSGFVWGGESKSESVDKAISDVNQKISEMQKQLPLLEATMKEKQEKIEELKKMFRNHSYHGIRDAQRQYDEAMNKHKQLEDNITALKGTLSELEKKKESDAKEALTKASELISAMGDKIGEHLGDKYKSVAKEIADDIKNFQGKTIRSYDDAMASLNKILSNPAMKVNQADKDALVNAWKSLNASDTASKLDNLSRTFKVADVALKVEKVREKSIEGYETGNWGPLMLEVESWVLSGVAVGVAMGILGYVAPVVAATVGLPVTAITIAGIIGISYLASFIDDKKADKINNEIIEIIKPSH
ncbi:TPA: hypothetical protein H1Q11_005231 [Salmonella enterica]|nr:hypothetical protein [Salmonella enterica]